VLQSTKARQSQSALTWKQLSQGKDVEVKHRALSNFEPWFRSAFDQQKAIGGAGIDLAGSPVRDTNWSTELKEQPGQRLEPSHWGKL
jgi:hypothetical protein